MVEGERRSELAKFLQSRRARLRPADVHLPNAGRRRAPGLRREEVAWLAGISADYYARLEQGRVARPSSSVLDALARTFGLSHDEWAYLLRIGDLSGRAPATLSREVPPKILRLLEQLTTIPAFVLDAKSDVLASNPLGKAMWASSAPPGQGNALRTIFLQNRPTRLHPADWERVARTAAADLRATAARYPDDPGVRELVGELTSVSTEFASFWSEHEVTPRTSDHYRLLHPDVGVLELDYEILDFHDGGQRLMVYSAEDGTESFGRLRDLCRNLRTRDAQRAGMTSA